MTVDRAGSLIVVFRNDATGQYRWRQQFTIAFQAGVFVVAGYSYTTRDTVTPGQGGTCDVDFISGQATRNGQPVKAPGPPTPLSAWSETIHPGGLHLLLTGRPLEKLDLRTAIGIGSSGQQQGLVRQPPCTWLS